MQCLVCDELQCLVCSTVSWALMTALLGVQESSVSKYVRPFAVMSYTLQPSPMHCTPDAERVSEGDEANSSNHADAAVGSLQQLHGGHPCLKHQLHLVVGGVTGHALLTAPLVRPVDLICQHIQQNLQQFVEYHGRPEGRGVVIATAAFQRCHTQQEMGLRATLFAHGVHLTQGRLKWLQDICCHILITCRLPKTWHIRDMTTPSRAL